ncbi:hypothetical protein MycrhDRAFT_1781 [Mycolicibacterium rhodesiae JS60]|nr:hypothetical protein MycrhDRAFT_1781 [Mycolicibacterium rhodesiae JS60]
MQARYAPKIAGATLVAAVIALTGAGEAHADQVVSGLTGFTSPSGNVGCMIEPSYVRCDILERDWSPPPRPAGCEFDYGQGIGLAPGQAARFVCAGDTALGGGAPLAYGESISAGTLSCTSTPSAMSCRDAQSGRGFSIARQSYDFF